MPAGSSTSALGRVGTPQVCGEHPLPGSWQNARGVYSQGREGKKLGPRPEEGASVWNEGGQTSLTDSRQPAGFGQGKWAMWTVMSPEDSSPADI